MLQESTIALKRAGLFPPTLADDEDGSEIRVKRRHECDRQRKIEAPACRYLVRLSLQAARLRLFDDTRLVFDGMVRPGTAQIVGPGRRLTAAFSAPCEVIELEVPASRVQAAQLAAADGGVPVDLGGHILRDALVERLGQVMASPAVKRDSAYALALAETMIARLAHLAQARRAASGLPNWRLKRVQSLIESNIAEPISLRELAAAAGLSRMHFASQFRASTGYSPHEYVVWHRIEVAKIMLASSPTALAEVALSVGFHAQAHFTTVFKRLTGETPARWRRAHGEQTCPAPVVRSGNPECRDRIPKLRQMSV